MKIDKHLPLGIAFACALLQSEVRKFNGRGLPAPRKQSKTYAPNGARECARRVRQMQHNEARAQLRAMIREESDLSDAVRDAVACGLMQP